MPPNEFQKLYDPTSKLELARTYGRSIVDGVRWRGRFAEVERFCLFIGYPRSGHTLVGSLLDAHPDVLIAHELDALRYVHHGFRRMQLFGMLVHHDRAFTVSGREWTGYDYRVDQQHQGSFRRLQVIGDKRGMMSTVRLAQEPGLLDKLRGLVGVPIRVVHVARNPYDNITTMATRAEKRIRRCTWEYEQLSGAVDEIRGRLAKDELLDLRYEDVAAEPKGALDVLCDFIGVRPTSSYLDDCAAVVRPASRTRDRLPWTELQRQRVIDDIIDRFDWLKGYTFDP
jgi:hypothetical protein